MVLSFLSSGFIRRRTKAVMMATRACYRCSSTAMVPRAAVAATIQWTCPNTKSNHYLLVQRKNPPDQGKWSCAGGKIMLGETTLTAARREVDEETQLRGCSWHSNSFLTTDAIVADDRKTTVGDDKEESNSYLFHYVIAHCFAKVPAYSSGNAPAIVPSDDAMDARWYTLTEIRNLDCSEHTIEVLERAEELSDLGLLGV